MKVETIALDELSVNARNDRHGEMSDEAAAMEWLLVNRGHHMRQLAKDIVETGRLYEQPLVRKEEEKYVVYDGNRRVTCLKLLKRPEHAPTEVWRTFFQKLRAGAQNPIPSEISCQVEDDLETIDEILLRRHTGSQDGIGQSHWDEVAKTNFINRTGKSSKVHVADEIEKQLRKHKLLDPKSKLPRSNLNRLLSSEALRNRVGIAVAKDTIKFTHNEEKTLKALQRIALDLISGEITLESIWSNKGKKSYLDKLEKQSVLPNAKDALPDFTEFKDFEAPTPIPAKSWVVLPPDPSKRTTLIPKNTSLDVPNEASLSRLLSIWTELQKELVFDRHIQAISVSFRVLLEMAINQYIARHQIQVHENDKLKIRFKKAAEHQRSKGLIDKKYLEALQKFENTEPLVSAHTMNQYVHSPNFFPSPDHLRPMWSNLEPFIVCCICK